MEKQIEFFKNVPFLKMMTKTQIQKTIYGIEKMDCIRNQVVCSEGQNPTAVYIVASGEFELKKCA